MEREFSGSVTSLLAAERTYFTKALLVSPAKVWRQEISSFLYHHRVKRTIASPTSRALVESAEEAGDDRIKYLLGCRNDGPLQCTKQAKDDKKSSRFCIGDDC